MDKVRLCAKGDRVFDDGFDADRVDLSNDSLQAFVARFRQYESANARAGRPGGGATSKDIRGDEGLAGREPWRDGRGRCG